MNRFSNIAVSLAIVLFMPSCGNGHGEKTSHEHEESMNMKCTTRSMIMMGMTTICMTTSPCTTLMTMKDSIHMKGRTIRI